MKMRWPVNPIHTIRVHPCSSVVEISCAEVFRWCGPTLDTKRVPLQRGDRINQSAFHVRGGTNKQGDKSHVI
jgi:hypothetical protein